MSDSLFSSQDDASWDDESTSEAAVNALLGPKNPKKVTPVAPPRTYSDEEEEYYDDEEWDGEDDDEYYEDDDEYYEDDEEYYEDDEEYYEDDENGEYYDDDEEYYEDDDQEFYEDDDQEYYEDEQGAKQSESFYDDEEFDDDDDWDRQENPGIASKITTAVSAVRKSLRGARRKSNHGYIEPSQEVIESYAKPIPIRIERDPTPLSQRIPQSMRAPKKLDYQKIKGNLKAGQAAPKRPLTGLHQKPVNPGGGERPRVSRRPPSARKPRPGRSAPAYVKGAAPGSKKNRDAPVLKQKRQQLKHAATSRPLTGYYQPLNNKPEETNKAVEDYTPPVKPAKPRRHKDGPGLVKASRPHYKRENTNKGLQDRRKGLKPTKRERPLTGYYTPVGGGKGPSGAASSKAVDDFKPKPRGPAKSRRVPRPKGEIDNRGVVKAAKPRYKKPKDKPQFAQARGKLKRGGPKDRPLTGIFRPAGGGSGPSGTEATNAVNDFNPKPKPRKVKVNKNDV